MGRPTMTSEFWENRIYGVLARGGMLHEIVYENSYVVWSYAQSATALILKDHIPPGSRVLDAGCGYGALLSCFQEAQLPVTYVGLDTSPDLLRIAKLRYGDFMREAFKDYQPLFVLGDLSDLRWEDGLDKFDWAVCRSVKSMVLRDYGEEAWARMEKELKRSANKVLVLDYPQVLDEKIPVEVL